MKHLFLSVFLLLTSLFAFAQDNIVYMDAASLPLYGKLREAGGPRYRRFVPELEVQLRPPVWKHGCCSAGLYLRFRTDAPSISAKWTNTGKHMPHMTDCGTGGLDLYAYIDGAWRFVGSGFNWGAIGKEHERRLVGDMEVKMREYMLYLSLYDEVKSLELGVPEGYSIEEPQLESPVSECPVVMYGTSILQGGCASRPGMAHTNIIARRLNRTVINLGFSGNAHLDYEVAREMAKRTDASVFVLDYVPNCTAGMIDEKGETFFRILRDACPDIPVVFVENPVFPHGVADMKTAEGVRAKNDAQKALYKRLKKAGEKKLYYVEAAKMTDSEDFVDGVHMTDKGMEHYADLLTPLLKKLVK